MKSLIIFLFISLNLSAAFGQCWKKTASKYDLVLAIHVDGTLWRWGARELDTPTLFNADTTWKDIATGSNFVAAIKSDGTLWMSGDNSYGQLGTGNTTATFSMTQVGTDTDWKQVSCGLGHTTALKTNGTLWAWGRNNYGQLGTGTGRSNSYVPMQLGTATDWVLISAGKNHTLAKKANNSMWFVGACYGTQVSQLYQAGSTNDWQTMSAGTTTDYAIKINGTLWKWAQSNGMASGIAQVGSASNWLKTDNSHAYTTETHALFIKTNGTLWAVGSNQFGQLGDNTLNTAALPVQVGTAAGWKSVVAGNTTSFAQREDFTFWGWGRNNVAQFGNGKNRNIPQPVVPANAWKRISAAQASYNGHTLAIKTDGTLWAWGQNNDGQLGIGSTYTHKATPAQAGTDTNWLMASGGFQYSAGIKSNGTLWTWGRNDRGQLGLGSAVISRTNPTQVGSDTTWKMVSAGGEFALAIKSNGTLWSWGYNFNGQLGNGGTATAFTPVQIGTDTNWIFISAGDKHSLAIRSDGTLWSWGSNQSGQLGRAGNTSQIIQVGTATWKTVSAGGTHSLGVQSNGSLWSWGRNLYAQLGDNTTNDRYVPTPIGGSQNWTSVAAGYEHSVALGADSSVWAWGRNASGQVADSVSYTDGLSKTFIPTRVDIGNNWKAITAGSAHSEGLTISGTIFTWGDSYTPDYQLNFPQLGYVQATPLQLQSCNYCPPSYGEFETTICSGDSVFFNGAYRHQPGNYSQTLASASGCDSIVTMHLNVLQPSFGTDIQTACESFTWIDGNTYTSGNSSAIFIISGGAANGCDSIVTLNLTILQPATGTDVQTACESFTWIDGNTYTSGNSSATFTISGGAANGCDSIVTLNLTILQPATGTDVQTACESFTWIDGNTYTSGNSSATFTISGGAANGCDSIVTLNLTINNADVATVSDGLSISAAANDAIYQWLDCSNGFSAVNGATNNVFTAVNNGSYAVTVTQNGCTDTSECNAITILELNENIALTGLSVYPNPTSGSFKISVNEVKDVLHVRLLTLLGQEVFNRSFTQTDSIGLEITAPDGVYLLEVSDGTGTALVRIVKE